MHWSWALVGGIKFVAQVLNEIMSLPLVDVVLRGCQQMILTSYSFQAPGFYQQLGYEVFAVLDEHPRSHRDYYLRKWLR